PSFNTACILSRPLVAHKGAPCGLANIGGPNSEALPEAAVARHGVEHAAAVDVRRVEDDPAVRREGGGLAPWAVGNRMTLPAFEIHGHQLEATADTGNVREGLAVRAHPRRHVVVAVESDAHRISAARRHPVDLRGPAPVRGEVD